MDKLKIIFIFIVLLIIILFVERIHDNPKERIITIGIFDESNWNVPSANPHIILEQAIAEFEVEHPDVKIKFISGIPKNDYYEWLSEKLLAGDEPDLFFVTSERFKDYAAMGALMDITDFVNNDSTFQKGKYYTAALDSVTLDKKYYGLPLECVPNMMFVNKTLLKKYGIDIPDNNWNWQDFYDICQAVTKDNDGDGNLDTYGCYGYNWHQAALTNGMRPIDDENRSYFFTDDKVEQAIRLIIALNNLNKGHTVTSRDFDLGNVAFRPFSFAEYRTYQPYPWRIKKYSGFEWDVVKFPAGPHGKNVSPIDTLAIAISSRTSNKYIAWGFLKKLSYDINTQMNVLEKSQGLPVRNDIITSAEGKKQFEFIINQDSQMSISMIDDIMNEAIPDNTFMRYQGVILKANNFIQKIIDGDISIDSSLNKLQKEININIDGI